MWAQRLDPQHQLEANNFAATRHRLELTQAPPVPVRLYLLQRALCFQRKLAGVL
jgi:hypothetical protein